MNFKRQFLNKSQHMGDLNQSTSNPYIRNAGNLNTLSTEEKENVNQLNQDISEIITGGVTRQEVRPEYAHSVNK